MQWAAKELSKGWKLDGRVKNEVERLDMEIYRKNGRNDVYLYQKTKYAS
jgi:hypothetical protein